MNVQISARVDSDIRDAAAQALAADGLDLSTGIKMFLKRTADTGSLPFAVGVRDDFVPSRDLQKTITEAKEGKNLSQPMELDEALLYLDGLG
ncbi:MAG: type II toxin-antitoxin system RelB/DinJ family antitoxin [Coriobacteriales bacterium]|jgi:addiction module RelB/DinJ family antitoxin|nr:type II toxin-antitoxin system RelB/DinJ family antitoxin [Coriobacteriales bacterium]